MVYYLSPGYSAFSGPVLAVAKTNKNTPYTFALFTFRSRLPTRFTLYSSGLEN
jgi:hypothetical protein